MHQIQDDTNETIGPTSQSSIVSENKDEDGLFPGIEYMEYACLGDAYIIHTRMHMPCLTQHHGKDTN